MKKLTLPPAMWAMPFSPKFTPATISSISRSYHCIWILHNHTRGARILTLGTPAWDKSSLLPKLFFLAPDIREGLSDHINGPFSLACCAPIWLLPPTCEIHTFHLLCPLAGLSSPLPKEENCPPPPLSWDFLSSQYLNRYLWNSLFLLLILSAFIIQSLLYLKLFGKKSAGQDLRTIWTLYKSPMYLKYSFISLAAHWLCSGEKLPRSFFSFRVHGLSP